MSAARPGSLRANPRLDQWLAFEADGTATVRSGKVEIGQGILTALAQVAAQELGLPIARVRMAATCTGRDPDEGVTSGSLSLQDSGNALRQVCREAHRLHLHEAARRWGVPVDGVRTHEGAFVADDGRSTTYADVRDARLLEREVTGEIALAALGALVGQRVPRLDIPDKVFGRPRFIHDIDAPGMLHGRVLRPPSGSCKLLAADLAPVRALPGVACVLQDGLQFGLLARSSAQADAALAALQQAVRWDAPEALPDAHALAGWLQASPSEAAVVLERGDPAPGTGRTLSATYLRPFVAHASLGPSCALARWEDAALSVWSHTQGVYNLRRDLALAFGRPDAEVVVQHVEGAGCYGHNGADDVAWDAAWLARAMPDHLVRVLWTRAGEFAEEPYGPAGVARLEAELDDAGNVRRWDHTLWSPGHSSRPGRAPTPTLLGSWYTADPFPRLAAQNVPAAMGGGAERNAVPGYAFPDVHVTSHRLLDTAIRASALRGLGALLNVFAVESFMDELAAAAGVDPVQFRLRHLEDARGRTVIERAVAASGWQPGGPRSEGHGCGLGYARYKGTGAWCAVVAQVEVDSAVRVQRLTLCADVGLVVNPDGAVNQLEGGAIQATSVTLKEAVRFDRRRIESLDWEGYPILRFSEVPAVDVDLVESDAPSLGAGEASFGPTAAAIANAVHDAIGLRMRALPFTPDRLLAAIHAGA